jgi:predicted RNA binding protein YcfA (HicA-like mRNA interferase family)
VTPWDDYNAKCDVVALLEKYGWTWIERKGERDYLKRPGKTDSHISADYHSGLGLFKVFSTSTEFETGKGYKPFAIYATLEHNGNFSEAAKQLIKDGFGEQRNRVNGNIKKDFVAKKDEGIDNDNIAAFISQKHKLDIKKAKKLVEDLDNDNDVQLNTFWNVVKGVINIDRYKLINV